MITDGTYKVSLEAEYTGQCYPYGDDDRSHRNRYFRDTSDSLEPPAPAVSECVIAPRESLPHSSAPYGVPYGRMFPGLAAAYFPAWPGMVPTHPQAAYDWGAHGVNGMAPEMMHPGMGMGGMMGTSEYGAAIGVSTGYAGQGHDPTVGYGTTIAPMTLLPGVMHEFDTQTDQHWYFQPHYHQHQQQFRGNPGGGGRGYGQHQPLPENERGTANRLDYLSMKGLYQKPGVANKDGRGADDALYRIPTPTLSEGRYTETSVGITCTAARIWVQRRTRDGRRSTAFTVLVRPDADIDSLKDAIRNALKSLSDPVDYGARVSRLYGGDSEEPYGEGRSVMEIMQTDGVGGSAETPFFFSEPGEHLPVMCSNCIVLAMLTSLAVLCSACRVLCGPHTYCRLRHQ